MSKEDKEEGEQVLLRVGSQGLVFITPHTPRFLSEKGFREGDMVRVSIEKVEIAPPGERENKEVIENE